MRSSRKGRILRFEHIELRAMLAPVAAPTLDSSIVESAVQSLTVSGGELPPAQAAGVDDAFNDGVFNADGQWDTQNITQGGQSPAHITYDEATSPGAFRVTYYTAGMPQTTMILRNDASLAVGDYVQVDVAFAAG